LFGTIVDGLGQHGVRRLAWEYFARFQLLAVEPPGTEPPGSLPRRTRRR